jgi:biotin carboxyl carrier protein
MTVWVEIAGKTRRVEIAADGAVTVDGAAFACDARMLSEGVLSLIVNGRSHRCVREDQAVLVDGRRFAFAVNDPRSLGSRRGHGAGDAGPRAVKAPMPGKVVRVLVEVGAEVEAGQGVVVIEAMKMQNELKAPKAGRVVKIAVVAGDTVAAGAVMVVVE